MRKKTTRINKIFNCWQIFIIFTTIIFSLYNNNNPLNYNFELNKKYLEIQLALNLTFNNKLKEKIKLAIYYTSIKNGGIERLTSLLLNYLDKAKIFDTYLLTQQPKEENEYSIPMNSKRIIVNSKIKKNNLFNILIKEKINILIYHFYNSIEIQNLNNLKKINIIIYNNSCIFYWIYTNSLSIYKTTYHAYQKSKYVISLVPFENDYLFKKWGINSILMGNFITYEYNSVIPSDLSSPTILMIGRGNDKLKRFELGIESMPLIIKQIPECEMKIISDLNDIDNLKKIIKFLKLQNNIKLVGYTPTPEIYFKNASLHIFPSISESFGLVLSETKIFGIPNILVGLDYLSITKGGTIMIYDDNSETISKEAIKILKNDKYRKKLGKEARKSMQKFKNIDLLQKWVGLILSIYNGYNYYEIFRLKDKRMPKKEAINILSNQIELLKNRILRFQNISINNIINFKFMENLQ